MYGRKGSTEVLLTARREALYGMFADCKAKQP